MMRLFPVVPVAFLLLYLVSVQSSSDFASDALRKFCSDAQSGLIKAVPALVRNPKRVKETTEVKMVRPKLEMRPKIDLQKINEKIKPSTVGSYYGITPLKMEKYTQKTAVKVPRKSTVELTLEEVRSMRLEMQALRKELQLLKKTMAGEAIEHEAPPEDKGISKVKRQRHFERIGLEIERWANELKNEGEEDGWQEVPCGKMFRSTLNREGKTKAFIKWMKDSRGEDAMLDDDREYPCIKVHSTIDAPMQIVGRYLSQKDHSKEYNDFVIQHEDLEELSPSSKIVWGASPKILFLQPRQFITFCGHRWLRDGTQVIVNQACDHEGKQQDLAEAYALRGANFIERDPHDPENKTLITIISHASPGRDVPTWAMKTACNALAPIEPFKLFNKINEGVKRALPTIQQPVEVTEMVSSTTGRSNRPAGIAQLGYACFWPEGGGLVETAGHHHEHQSESHEEHIDPKTEVKGTPTPKKSQLTKKLRVNGPKLRALRRQQTVN